MSWETQSWAGKQRPGSASAKLVLLGLASCADASHCAYPSIDWLCDFSDLNRKTVISALQRLEDGEAPLISDTGERRGRTKQVKVYRLAAPGEGDAVGGKHPKSGTVPKPVQSQKRNSSGFSGKESQNRDTEPFREPIPLSDPDGSDAPPAGKKDEVKKPAAGAEPAKPVRPKRGEGEATPLPADWSPPRIENLPETARQLVRQWPRGAYQASCEMFRLHWSNATGSNSRKKSWGNALSKWLIKDHPEMMRAGRAGVSFAALSPAAAEADADAAPKACDAVPEQKLEGGMADGLRAALRKAMKGPMFDQWFGPAALLIQDDALRVVVRSQFTANYIEANCLPALLSAAEAAGLTITLITAHVSRAGASHRLANNEKDPA